MDRARKRELLSHLVRTHAVDQALVFTRTKHGADRLAQQLQQDGIATAAIHGNKSQPQRIRALKDFKEGRVTLLIATEVAARGLDIEQLPHVVNYELPMVPSDYLHRIGRTGRAGIEGDAISLVCIDEAPLLREIERLLGRPIPSEIVPGFEPDRSIRPEPIRLRTGGGGGGGRPQVPRGPRRPAPAAWAGGRQARPARRPQGRAGGSRTETAAASGSAFPASEPAASSRRLAPTTTGAPLGASTQLPASTVTAKVAYPVRSRSSSTTAIATPVGVKVPTATGVPAVSIDYNS